MENKINKAIQRIKVASNYYQKIKLAFSGGKDSIVIYQLSKLAGIQFDAVYQNTTIDPPGLIQFIKKNYPEIEIQNPEQGFFALVKQKGLPNRFRRWCCVELKENNKGYDMVITGVRREESRKRSKYKIIGKRKDVIELRPIIDWTEIDIWDFIRKYNLPYPKYYDEPYNFSRLGCILCPLANKKQRIYQAQIFPKYTIAFLKSIEKYRLTHPTVKQVKATKDAYHLFYLYLIDGLNRQGFENTTNLLFDYDYKKILEKLLGYELPDFQKETTRPS